MMLGRALLRKVHPDDMPATGHFLPPGISIALPRGSRLDCPSNTPHRCWIPTSPKDSPPTGTLLHPS